VNGRHETRQVAAERLEFLVSIHIVPIKHGSERLNEESKRGRNSPERECEHPSIVAESLPVLAAAEGPGVVFPPFTCG
jgi:hypothetical protein